MGAEEALAAFRAHDFDNDPGWQHYRGNLEIPAGKEGALLKFKAKWFQREKDADLDVSVAVGGPSVPSPPGTGQNGSSGATHTAAAGASPPVTKPGASPSSQGLLQRLMSVGPEAFLFAAHTMLVLLALAHLQPLDRALSFHAWRYFLILAILVHGTKVGLKYGAPPIWPFSFAALKGWLQPVSGSTDFQYTFVCGMFLSARPVLLVMVPIVVLSVYHWLAFASKHFGHYPLWRSRVAPFHAKLVASQQAALLLNAGAEIGTGFLTIFNLFFPPRSFLLPFVYWQFLRMRFWSPDAATYHRLAWQQLGTSAGPWLDRIPIAKTAIGYVQNWFMSAGVPR